MEFPGFRPSIPGVLVARLEWVALAGGIKHEESPELADMKPVTLVIEAVAKDEPPKVEADQQLQTQPQGTESSSEKEE